MRKLTEEQRDQLKLLYDRITLTLDFFENVEGLGQIGVQIRDGAKTAHARGDLRALRLLLGDIDSLTVALPLHEREGLEALLGSRLGVDTDAERRELRRRVTRALSRGTIASEKERRHLEAYLDLSEATGGDAVEADAVRRLLSS